MVMGYCRGWSRGRVHRFLSSLCGDEIELKRVGRGRGRFWSIRLLNYDRMQGKVAGGKADDGSGEFAVLYGKGRTNNEPLTNQKRTNSRPITDQKRARTRIYKGDEKYEKILANFSHISEERVLAGIESAIMVFGDPRKRSGVGWRTIEDYVESFVMD